MFLALKPSAVARAFLQHFHQKCLRLGAMFNDQRDRQVLLEIEKELEPGGFQFPKI
jgi:hypothetical protein